MAHLSAVVSYFDGLLQPEKFSKDPSVNGLQVEGNETVSRVVFGVDASEALIQSAIELDADMIVVHHGLFWEGMSRRVTGIMAERLRLLLCNGISLYAMHLPLDAQPEWGHNAVLAQMIGLTGCEPFFNYAGCCIGQMGNLPAPRTVKTLLRAYEAPLECKAQVFGRINKSCTRIGIVSGNAGIGGICEGIERKLDCMVVGQFDHEAWHFVQESDMTVIALGHYCSEKPGIFSLMNRLHDEMDLPCEFVDIPTGL